MSAANQILIFFLGIQLADVLTTMVGLSVGASEQNPLAAWCFEQIGPLLGVPLYKIAIVALVVAAILRLDRRFPARRLHWYTLRAANVYYGVVVIANLVTIAGFLA